MSRQWGNNHFLLYCHSVRIRRLAGHFRSGRGRRSVLSPERHPGIPHMVWMYSDYGRRPCWRLDVFGSGNWTSARAVGGRLGARSGSFLRNRRYQCEDTTCRMHRGPQLVLLGPHVDLRADLISLPGPVICGAVRLINSINPNQESARSIYGVYRGYVDVSPIGCTPAIFGNGRRNPSIKWGIRWIQPEYRLVVRIGGKWAAFLVCRTICP